MLATVVSSKEARDGVDFLPLTVDVQEKAYALGRLPGWIAQWREMRLMNEPIGRPRQLYTGYKQREYIELEKRDSKKSILKSISSLIKTGLKKR